jgi:hypothetical protein
VLGAAAALEGEERWTLDKVLAMHKEGGVTGEPTHKQTNKFCAF